MYPNVFLGLKCRAWHCTPCVIHLHEYFLQCIQNDFSWRVMDMDVVSSRCNAFTTMGWQMKYCFYLQRCHVCSMKQIWFIVQVHTWSRRKVYIFVSISLLWCLSKEARSRVDHLWSSWIYCNYITCYVTTLRFMRVFFSNGLVCHNFFSSFVVIGDLWFITLHSKSDLLGYIRVIVETKLKGVDRSSASSGWLVTKA